MAMYEGLYPEIRFIGFKMALLLGKTLASIQNLGSPCPDETLN
jgi:hypothetical protein